MKFKILFRLIGLLHSTKLLNSLLLLLLLLAITNEVAIYHIGLITGDYYQILNSKDHQGFIRQTVKSVLLIAGTIVILYKLYPILTLNLLFFCTYSSHGPTEELQGELRHLPLT